MKVLNIWSQPLDVIPSGIGSVTSGGVALLVVASDFTGVSPWFDMLVYFHVSKHNKMQKRLPRNGKTWSKSFLWGRPGSDLATAAAELHFLSKGGCFSHLGVARETHSDSVSFTEGGLQQYHHPHPDDKDNELPAALVAASRSAICPFTSHSPHGFAGWQGTY